MSLFFKELFDSAYKKGNLPVQILAIRPNTNSYWEIVVTDYTRNSGSAFPVEDNRIVFTENEKKTLRVDAKVIEGLASEYRNRTGRDLFSAGSLDPRNSNWLDIFHNFCFVQLFVTLQVGVHLSRATNARMVTSATSEIPGFWSRFVAAVSGRLAFDSGLILSVVGDTLDDISKSKLRSNPDSDIPGASRGNSPQVKIELDSRVEDVIKIETSVEPSTGRQNLLGALLEPEHPPKSSAQNFSGDFHDLSRVNGAAGHANANSTQVFSSQVMFNNERQHDMQVSGSQEFLTQLNHLEEASPIAGDDNFTGFGSQAVSQLPVSDMSYTSFVLGASGSSSKIDFGSMTLDDIYMAQKAGQLLELASLNKLPLAMDQRIYKTRAKIAGTIPNDLSLLCTKSYISKNGAVTTSDPHLRMLEIVLVDSPDEVVTSDTSLSVFVPHSQILSFFGCTYTEQLYTQMAQKAVDFSKLLGKQVYLDLSVGLVDDVPSWVVKDTSLKKLSCNEPS